MFDGEREAVVTDELAAFLRPAHMNPVGGPVTGADVAGGAAERLQQDGVQPIAVESVLRQATRDQRWQVRG